MKIIKELSDLLLATLLPIACQLCGEIVAERDLGVACQRCWAQATPLADTAGCNKCGYPLKLAPGYSPSPDCSYCRELTFHSARATGHYQGALRANLLYLKRHPVICARLEQLMLATFSAHPALQQCQVIMPVPLHPTRRRERGFNQAETIAHRLVRLTGLPLDCASLIRKKSTPKHRTGLDAIDRSNNLHNAFQVVRPRMITGQRILLVDDVFTTGSTISACAQTLLASGASQVEVLTLARVVADREQRKT